MEYDKKALERYMQLSNADKSLEKYFKRQLKKGYKKYKTNNLGYCTKKELQNHLLEEIIDAIVYSAELKKRLVVWQLVDIASYLAAEIEKGEKL